MCIRDRSTWGNQTRKKDLFFHFTFLNYPLRQSFISPSQEFMADTNDLTALSNFVENLKAQLEVDPNNADLKAKIRDLMQYLMFLRFRSYFLKKKFESATIVKVRPDYYNLSLTERKFILNAPSEAHLCKTIVMENTAFVPENESKHYFRYVAVIIQYVTRIHSEKIMKACRDIQNNNPGNGVKLGKRAFHYRLLDDAEADKMTGYGYNGVTPFLLKTPMPVILSDKITKLSPQCFWLGGGDVDLKIRISVDEFLTKNDLDVFVCDVVYDEQVLQVILFNLH
eukprot:TRINITY_DN7310_c0_g1_i1.p1 TRINITY_DN7310_c0_g1~~TRINITY_DN7310_c0_g1_i1.p1  ORF type:complete len:314 (+),score=59.94 TRINITY_DN7310_c0_g1_i1:98-943(+)